MNMRLVKVAVKAEGRDGARREQALLQLKDALRQLFVLRHAGVAHAEITQAQGLVDGYMNCLLDLGLVSDSELLALVVATRRGVDGPATGTLSTSALESDVTAARATA